MIADLNLLKAHVQKKLEARLQSVEHRLGELTLTVAPNDLLAVLKFLRDDNECHFEQLIDLCGVDYSAFGSETSENGAYLADGFSVNPFERRFGVVYHLLSVAKNQRVRVRVFPADDVAPMLNSVIEIWPAANWFEREAFDMFGIVFLGHPDLRRILTDYGFVGNPFRKDFPLSGQVEMHYDAEQKRVVYSPVTVEPREVTPRAIREENFSRH
jgi:NADH-quinone oxidoreductase subunit C